MAQEGFSVIKNFPGGTRDANRGGKGGGAAPNNGRLQVSLFPHGFGGLMGNYAREVPKYGAEEAIL